MKNGDFPIANGHLFEWENPCPPCQSPSLQGLGRDVDLWNASTGPARHAGHGRASGERRKKRWKISKITMLFMGKSPFFMGNQLCIAMLFMENYGNVSTMEKLWKTVWKTLWKITMLFMGKLTISTGPCSIANCIAM